MNRKEVPHRVTLWENEDIDYNHVLSDGFGIPAVVISCPIESEFGKYTGKDEYAEEVEGISFDDCMDCGFFGGFGLGQEIYCTYKK
ncbi:MAG: hypothetical protein IMY77_03785 [Chloroflexi bacterium]|nr:hypothetical protein [Chloroflexota bacterium]